jgi:hypothetical protein
VSQSGTWNLNNITGTVSLPTGAATSANQTNGNQKTQIAGTLPSPQGRPVAAIYSNDYSGTNLNTGSFNTLISSTSSVINEEDIYDTAGQDYYLSYAASCGALTLSANTIIISAGGGGKDFQIPVGQCVGAQAKTANITAGTVNMTFYQ